MSGTHDSLGRPEGQPATILDQLRTAQDQLRGAQKRITDREALLAGAYADLEIERRNGNSLHQALDSLQMQHRRARSDRDELTGVPNRRIAEDLRTQLADSHEKNTELCRRLQERLDEVTGLARENRRLVQDVEDLKGQVQSTNDLLSTQLSNAAGQEEELMKAKETIESYKEEVDDLQRKIRNLEARC
ncbi:hypothetical protein AAVH_27366, partial [Aphelenchoides avenae]